MKLSFGALWCALVRTGRPLLRPLQGATRLFETSWRALAGTSRRLLVLVLPEVLGTSWRDPARIGRLLLVPLVGGSQDVGAWWRAPASIGRLLLLLVPGGIPILLLVAWWMMRRQGGRHP